MKIMVLGKGFISSHLQYPKIVDEIDDSSKQIGAILDCYTPDVIVNCIGKTGSNIDWCLFNKNITSASNTTIPILLGYECAKRSIHLVHLSSGCIFYGDAKNINNGWYEDDFANPNSFYSRTKYASDLILSKMPNCTVLRINSVISDKNHEKNLINKLLKYKQIVDIPGSFTFSDDLVKLIDWCAKNSQTGVFHATNPGCLTPAQIIMEYKKYIPNHDFHVISQDELDILTIEKRSHSVLNTDKLNKHGFFMQPAEVALKNIICKYLQ
jgi:3,5-epimerase/4-reductase